MQDQQEEWFCHRVWPIEKVRLLTLFPSLFSFNHFFYEYTPRKVSEFFGVLFFVSDFFTRVVSSSLILAKVVFWSK